MGKNLIPLIAKELGVEISEEFKLTHYDTKWRFTENNLQFFNLFGPEEDQGWLNALDATLRRVIIGELKIIKLPFEPKVGEIFWTYWQNWSVTDFEWEDNKANFDFKKFCGCVFRTKEEALAARPVKFKEITGKEWEE